MQRRLKRPSRRKVDSGMHRSSGDADFTGAPVIRDSLVGASPFTQHSQELRIAGRNPDLLGTLINLIEPLLTPVIGERQAAYVSLRQRTQNYAAFGQIEHFFLPHWAVLAGLRVGVEEKSGRAISAPEGELIGLITRDSQGNPTVGAHDTPLSREESEFSPKAGLKWAP